MNELQDVSIAACFLNLLLRNLGFGFGGAKQDVETNRASVEGRFLRHQGDVLAVILNVQLVDLFAVDVDVTSERVVESFDQLDAIWPIVNIAPPLQRMSAWGNLHSTLA